MRRLVDLWLARRAEPSPAALQAIAGLAPATVVTGGSRGIGQALARRFAQAGYTVVIIARQADALTAAAEAIQSEWEVRAFALTMDVTDPDAPSRIDAFLAANGLYLDTLINCAGIGLAGPFVSHAEPLIEDLLSLNVTALTRLMRHALPGMLARGRGGIINVASAGGLVPGPNQAAYYASKAYVVSLTRAVATEIAGRGVRLMALAPGPVDTAFHWAMGAESSPYRRLLVSLSASQTAREAYPAYILGMRLYVPGLTAKFLQFALWIVPHFLVLPLISWLLQRPQERPGRGIDDSNA